MAENTKGWISKLFTLHVFALMVFQAVVYIHPMSKDDWRYDGVCNISSLIWYNETCTRNPDYYHLYDVPLIMGGFVELSGRPTIAPGTLIRSSSTVSSLQYNYLWVNESNTDAYGRGGPKVGAFLFDDGSSNPLMDCSLADIVSTKKLVVYYIPELEPFLDVESVTTKSLSSLPNFFFNCTYENHNQKYGAFLQYKRTNKLYVIPFLITLLACIYGLYLIRTYDVEGPIKEFAEFILQILFMFVFSLHYIFYMVFRIIIGQILFNIEPPEPMDDFKAGSIFFPVVWLFKKLWNVFYKSNNTTEDSARPGSQTEVSPEPMPTITPRESLPQINTRPHAPPHALHKPPSYPTIDAESTVIPNTVIVYHRDGAIHLDMLPPPPSYDEVVNNNM